MPSVGETRSRQNHAIRLYVRVGTKKKLVISRLFSVGIQDSFRTALFIRRGGGDGGCAVVPKVPNGAVIRI